MIAGIGIYDLRLVLVAWHGLRASRLCDISGTTNKQHLIKIYRAPHSNVRTAAPDGKLYLVNDMSIVESHYA